MKLLFKFLYELDSDIQIKITILEFILLYKLIQLNELTKYKKQYINYIKVNSNNKNNMTTYTPKNMLEAYENMKMCVN